MQPPKDPGTTMLMMKLKKLGGCVLQGCCRIEYGGYAYFKYPHEMHIGHIHACLSHAMLCSLLSPHFSPPIPSSFPFGSESGKPHKRLLRERYWLRQSPFPPTGHRWPNPNKTLAWRNNGLAEKRMLRRQLQGLKWAPPAISNQEQRVHKHE